MQHDMRNRHAAKAWTMDMQHEMQRGHSCSMDKQNEQASGTWRMDMRHLHGNAAQTYSMDMLHIAVQQRHTAWTCCILLCNIDIQNGEAALTGSLSMQHWHVERKCSIDMQYWHAEWTCCTDIQQGYAAWICGMDTKHWNAAWTWSMDVKYGHETNVADPHLHPYRSAWFWSPGSASRTSLSKIQKIQKFELLIQSSIQYYLKKNKNLQKFCCFSKNGLFKRFLILLLGSP
jgi:hypothetical protein